MGRLGLGVRRLSGLCGKNRIRGPTISAPYNKDPNQVPLFFVNLPFGSTQSHKGLGLSQCEGSSARSFRGLVVECFG